MLTKVEVRTDQGVLLTLSMEDPSNGYIIEEIDGLDPVKATLVSSSFAQLDGQQYQSSRREARNLVFHLLLKSEYTEETARQLRKRLYAFFMPKANVNLRFFMADGLVVNISGKVETFEADLFTEEPRADISIMCFNPDFVDQEVTTISGSTTALEIETLVEYDGEVETGVVFTLFVDRDIAAFTIYHRPPDDQMRTLEFAGDLNPGDTLTISTVPGDKWARLLRDGTTSSILYGISPYSNWIEFMPGDNHIRVYALGDAVPFEFEYANKYGGL